MDSLSKRTFTNKKTEKLSPSYAVYNYYLNSKSYRGYSAAKYYLTSLTLLVASPHLNNYFIFTQTQMLFNFIIFK